VLSPLACLLPSAQSTTRVRWLSRTCIRVTYIKDLCASLFTPNEGCGGSNQSDDYLTKLIDLQGIVRLSIDLFNPGADISSFNVVD